MAAAAAAAVAAHAPAAHPFTAAAVAVVRDLTTPSRARGGAVLDEPASSVQHSASHSDDDHNDDAAGGGGGGGGGGGFSPSILHVSPSSMLSTQHLGGGGGARPSMTGLRMPQRQSGTAVQQSFSDDDLAESSSQQISSQQMALLATSLFERMDARLVSHFAAAATDTQAAIGEGQLAVLLTRLEGCHAQK